VSNWLDPNTEQRRELRALSEERDSKRFDRFAYTIIVVAIVAAIVAIVITFRP
jgi:hypothetical protein